MIPRRILPFFLAILVLLTSLSAGPRPQANERFFERTQHWVRGEFLVFYDSIPDAKVLLGDPITEAEGDRFRAVIQVQYFERGRLELDPAKPAGQRVSISNLGQLLFNDTQRGAATDYSVTSNMCTLFEQTGKYVCYAFRDYYAAHQGATYFGQPISNTEVLDGRLVQYFERARMEWYPERQFGQRVVLTELGRIYFEMINGQKGVDIPSSSLESLEVKAFVSRAALAANQEQTVFVVVRQNGKPVAGVQPFIRIIYPGPREKNIRPEQPTDESGMTSQSFQVENVPPNQLIHVIVEVEIFNGPAGSTSTSFRIWW